MEIISKKGKFIGQLWWILPLLIFDFFYYYFILYMVEQKGSISQVEIHGEALIFLFIISLISIGCVWLSDRLLGRFKRMRISGKYLINIFLSFGFFITLVVGSQYLIEYSNGSQPISYLINQSIIFLFLHLIVGNATIAISYFNHSKELTEQLLILEKGKAEKDLKILQQQMSPHFLFNNLNTLISLIPSNPEKAILYTRKLSAIYRHSSDHMNDDLIELTKEIKFLMDYMELLSHRFGSSFKLEYHLNDSQTMNYLIVPMSLQILIENVLKHNSSSKAEPLKIILEADKDHLIVTNQKRYKQNSDGSKSGIGLKNLDQQYQLIIGKSLTILDEPLSFQVKLPLTKQVQDEDFDH